MLKRIKRLNIIGYVLVGFQALVYFSSLTRKSESIEDPAELAGYYFGYNLWLMIAIVLFIKARNIRKKLKQLELKDMVDSIGSD